MELEFNLYQRGNFWDAFQQILSASAIQRDHGRERMQSTQLCREPVDLRYGLTVIGEFAALLAALALVKNLKSGVEVS